MYPTLLEMLDLESLSISRQIAETELSLNQAPEGSLRISYSDGYLRYRHVRPQPGSLPPKDTYLNKQQARLARALAQKDYNQRVLPLLQKEFRLLEPLRVFLSDAPYSRLYHHLHPQRQLLIDPLDLPIDQYAQAWLSVPYVGKSFDSAATTFETSNHDIVRSKSEWILADLFFSYEIPYRYEFPVSCDGFTMYPDFMLLNKRTRREFYWEHFGLIDNPSYAETFVKKLNSYEKCGILLGKNLIATFESSSRPLNISLVHDYVHEFLL